MCENCNHTGYTRERREGTDYPYACKECEIGENVANLTVSDFYRLYRQQKDRVPVKAVC